MVRTLLMVIAAAGLAAPSQSHTWLSGESRGARVLSNVSPEAVSRTLADIESAEALFGSLAGATLSKPVRAFVVRNADSLRELAPHFWDRRGIRPHAVAYEGPHHAFIAVRDDLAPEVRREALLHEYVHLLTAAQTPDAPAWLDEGLSEFWGNVVIEGDRIIVGRAVKKHVSRLGRGQSLERTLQLKRGEFIADSEPSTLFYAQSWAMAHYLLLGRDGDNPQALVPSFKPLPGDFETAVRDYIRKGDYREVSLPFALPKASPTTVSFIPESRALAERAQMLVFGPRPDSAVSLAKRALALEPREAVAIEVMGTHYFLRNQHADARTWLTRAFDSGTASPAVSIYLALLAPSSAERERYLQAAIHSQPSNDIAWQRLVDLYQKDGRLQQLRRWCHQSALRPFLWATANLPGCA